MMSDILMLAYLPIFTRFLVTPPNMKFDLKNPGIPVQGLKSFFCAGSLKQGYLNSAPAKLSLRGLNEGFIQVSGSKSPRQTSSCGCLGHKRHMGVPHDHFQPFLEIPCDQWARTYQQPSIIRVRWLITWKSGKDCATARHPHHFETLIFFEGLGETAYLQHANFHVLAQDVLETKTME